MKSTLALVAALALSTAAFAQTNPQNDNTPGNMPPNSNGRMQDGKMRGDRMKMKDGKMRDDRMMRDDKMKMKDGKMKDGMGKTKMSDDKMKTKM